MPLTSVIARIEKVSPERRAAMFELHNRHFRNVRRDAFFADLAEKEWVILLLDGDTVAGFSTLQEILLLVGGRRCLFLFSGDTIVDRAHWQDSTLAGCFGHFMRRLIREHPAIGRYWFLISKGYRTYRFLPVYFNAFYPAFRPLAPPEYAERLRAIANYKFGRAYDAASGLVRFNPPRDALAADLCEVPESRKNDPHVRFFLEKNPGYARGDELACLAEIAEANLNRYAWHAIDQTRVIWDE